MNIRRENRVCSLHFNGGRKTGKLDIPVIFPWTNKPRQSPKKRMLSCSEAPQSSTSLQELLREVVSQHVSDDDDDCDELLTDVLTYDDVRDEVDGAIIDEHHEQVTVKDASTNTDTVSFSDVGIQSVALMAHVDVQTDEINIKDAEIQATVTTEEASTDVNTKLLNNKDVSTSTDDLCAPLAQFSLETFKDDDKAIRFYTGFASYKCFMICFNFLGPAVATLCYHEKSSGKEASFMGRNEYFLTLCRLRAGLKKQDLAYRFGISQSTV